MKTYWFALFVIAGVLFLVDRAGLSITHFVAPIRLSLPFAPLVLVLQAIYWGWLSYIWARLVYISGGKHMRIYSAFVQISVTGLGKYIPGKIWGVAARISVMRDEGIDTKDAVRSSYYEQIYSLHAGAVVSAISYGAVAQTPAAILLAIIAVASIPIGSLLQSRITQAFFWLISRVQCRSTPPPSREPGYTLFVLAYSLLWLISGLLFATLYLTFVAPEINSSRLTALLLANTAGTWLGFIALFAPGGIGVREAAIVAILSAVMPIEEAITLTIISRAFQFSCDAISGGVVVLWLSKRKRANKEGSLSF